MQASVTDTSSNITFIRDVARIEINLSNSTNERSIYVYLEESMKMGSKQLSNSTWLNDPLLLDLNNSKVIQAMQLLKEVIESAEATRIKEKHKITNSSSPSPSNSTTPSPTPVVNIPITIKPLG